MHTTIQPGQTIPDEGYMLGVVADDDTLHLFDTPREVICELDAGYLDARDNEIAAYERRLFLAARLIDKAQADLMRTCDPLSLSEAQRWALSARGKRAVTEVERWEGPVPLFVSAVFHRPYTCVPLPAGVSVVDPSTEAALVASLADTGIIQAVDPSRGGTWGPRGKRGYDDNIDAAPTAR